MGEQHKSAESKIHPFVSIASAKSIENTENLNKLELEVYCVGGFLYKWMRAQFLKKKTCS